MLSRNGQRCGSRLTLLASCIGYRVRREGFSIVCYGKAIKARRILLLAGDLAVCNNPLMSS
jgi:hypothetical protein